MPKTRQIDLEKAFNCTDIREFLKEVFPDEWAPLAARIIESGAVFRDIKDFAPRWTDIPFTLRKGKSDSESYLKSMIFRVHDCLHQLWGLPVPKTFDDKEYKYFKRMWMCAEVSVLTIVEFFYCKWLYDTQDHMKEFLLHRNTLLFKQTTSLKDATMLETAARLDHILHRAHGNPPSWVTENEYGRIFAADFIPMLAIDRLNIDHNWKLLVEQHKRGETSYMNLLPNQRYSNKLDGLELTTWMINDFQHLLKTDEKIDEELAKFNMKRRSNVKLPDTWNYPPDVKQLH